MSEKVEYVHVHFHQAVSSPARARASKTDASVFLDAFLDDGQGKRKRTMKIERDGGVLIATDLATGRVREYPWSAARQATRADKRYVDDDPRTVLREVPEAKGKP